MQARIVQALTAVLMPIILSATAHRTQLRKLRELPDSGGSPFLFPSPSRDGYMSNNTMLYALYRMGYHGREVVPVSETGG